MSQTRESAAVVLEALRSRNRVDFAERPRPVPKRDRPRLAGWEPETEGSPIDMRPRIARHRGTCRICEKRIWEGNEEEPGEEIVPLPGGGWAHFYCAEEEAAKAA